MSGGADEFDDERNTAVGPKIGWQYVPPALADMTTEECAVVLSGPRPTVLLPLGALGPRGPHLPLGTGALLADECAKRSVRELRRVGVSAVVAPALTYGVARLGSGFAGAVSLSPAAVEHVVRELCWAYRSEGFGLVCVIDLGHEPDQIQAATRAVDGTRAAAGGAIFAHPLLPRWAAGMPEELRRGSSHAGAFETSLVHAAKPGAVREALASRLPPVNVVVQDGLRAGKVSYGEMGMSRGYAGAPAQGNADDGEDLFTRLVQMVVTEVREAHAQQEAAAQQ